MRGVSFEAFLAGLPASIPKLAEHPLDFALKQSRPAGLIVECGVYTGSSIRRIAAAAPGSVVYGFDSFEGLPEDWGRPDMKFDEGAFSLGGRLPSVPGNVRLVAGWFDRTLPRFAAEHSGDTIAFLHVDCDLYSSTKCVFDSLGPLLQRGSVIVFDELLNYPTFERHEVRAFYEFLCGTGHDVEWIGKLGDVDLRPERDNGYTDQPVACRLA